MTDDVALLPAEGGVALDFLQCIECLLFHNQQATQAPERKQSANNPMTCSQLPDLRSAINIRGDLRYEGWHASEQ